MQETAEFGLKPLKERAIAQRTSRSFVPAKQFCMLRLQTLRQISAVVAVIKERRQPPITTLRYMVRQTRNHNSC